MKRLDNKVALVTGGTSGIGLATARRFADEGAHVFVPGRRPAEVDRAVHAIGRQVTGVAGDVANPNDGLGLSKGQVQGFIDQQAGTIPLGRVGTPDEIAKALVFLASEDSSFVDAIGLFVDAGMTQV